MIRFSVACLIATAAFAAPVAAQQHEQYGKETFINAGAGFGIRNWESAPGNVVFLQDSSLRWYRVQLSGPCAVGGGTLKYKTSVDGRFDRLSGVVNSRLPGMVCAVDSVTTSPPPPGQHSKPKPD